jgi:hypothetical protein
MTFGRVERPDMSLDQTRIAYLSGNLSGMAYAWTVSSCFLHQRNLTVPDATTDGIFEWVETKVDTTFSRPN